MSSWVTLSTSASVVSPARTLRAPSSSRVRIPLCTPERWMEVGLTPEAVTRAGNPTIYRAKGCEVCAGTGYRGRTGIYELLMVDDDIRQLTLKNVDSTSIKRSGVQKGMRTLLDDGARKILAGETTLAEVLSITQEDI